MVPCTKSKSQSVEAAMRFDALVSSSCAFGVRRWLQAADQCETLTVARALYAGTGWNCTSRAQNLLDHTCELWIASAGFGLVAGDERLPAYEATFAAQNNRVADRLLGFKSPSTAHAAWWAAINEARGKTPTPLQTTFSGYERVIVALSAPYMTALRSDLELLAETLGPDALWLVAVGAQPQTLSPSLRECVVPLTSDIEGLVAGARITLNMRALIWWLEEIVPVAGWNRAAQRREIECQLRGLKPKTTIKKQSLSDAEVVNWIEKQRDAMGREWPRGGKTGLLRTLRAGGLACEQSRFSRLYAEVTQGQ